MQSFFGKVADMVKAGASAASKAMISIGVSCSCLYKAVRGRLTLMIMCFQEPYVKPVNTTGSSVLESPPVITNEVGR